MPIPTSMNPFGSPFFYHTLFRLECIGKINYIAVVLLSRPIVCFIFSIQFITYKMFFHFFSFFANWTNRDGQNRLKHKFIAFAFFPSHFIFPYLDVLSAAHCVHGIDRRHIKIYIGGHNITTDYVDTRRVARIFEHEYFDSISFDFDIAILELSKPIEFGSKIQPACLPQTQFQDYSGKTALIAGWGRLGRFFFLIGKEWRKINL